MANGLERLYKHDPGFNTLTVQGGHVAIRMAALDEVRNRCLDRRDLHHRNIVRKEQLKARWTAPKVGDLVLLRRMALEGQRSHKIAARWEGPFLLDDVHAEGRAGRLRDIHSGTLVKIKASGAKERVHLDDLKVFVPRTEVPQGAVNAVELKDWVPPGGIGGTEGIGGIGGTEVIGGIGGMEVSFGLEV
jgi:hypothetical protein